MNVSSEISSLFLFFVEEWSPGLTFLVSPLGDPSDSQIEFEIILLPVESSLSLISSMDRTLYLLLSLAHPDWYLGLRLFPSSRWCSHNLWTRYKPCQSSFLEWPWTNHGPCPYLCLSFWCFYPCPRRLHLLLLSWHCGPIGHLCHNGSSPSYMYHWGIYIRHTASVGFLWSLPQL